MAIEANFHEIWVSAWHPSPPPDYFHPIMIHCPVPQDIQFVQEISISQNVACEENPLTLKVEKTDSQAKEKGNFCVCVKPLDFPNEPRLARRLMEWIESNLRLGAQKIVIYVYSGIKFLTFFSSQGGARSA